MVGALKGVSQDEAFLQRLGEKERGYLLSTLDMSEVRSEEEMLSLHGMRSQDRDLLLARPEVKSFVERVVMGKNLVRLQRMMDQAWRSYRKKGNPKAFEMVVSGMKLMGTMGPVLQTQVNNNVAVIEREGFARVVEEGMKEVKDRWGTQR